LQQQQEELNRKKEEEEKLRQQAEGEEQERKKKKNTEASLTLQSHWRGKKARKVYKELKAEFRERQEAIDREKKRIRKATR